MTATLPIEPVQVNPVSSKRIPELDGIRGIAALMVVFYHFGSISPAPQNVLLRAWNVTVGLGWTAVDLFFVLSGCLITGILLDTRDSPRFFRSFYGRRMVRILPLYYAAVMFFFWIYLPLAHMAVARGVYATNSQSWMNTGFGEQVWYWLHVSNWRTAFGHLEVSPVSHLWSLAIEEQFYFLWPLVVYRTPEKRLLKICAMAIGLSFLSRNIPYFQVQQAMHPGFLYRLTPFRVDPLLYGACIPLLARLPEIRSRVRPWFGPALVLGFCGFAAACLWAGSTDLLTAPMTRLGYSSLGLFWFVIVSLLVESSGSRARVVRFLRGAFLTRAGEISYGIYVINLLIASVIALACKRIFPAPHVSVDPIAGIAVGGLGRVLDSSAAVVALPGAAVS